MKNSTIPIVTSALELKTLMHSYFSGVANVQLNSETVDFLLTLNTKNRKIKTRSVDAYVSAFEKFGYESIGLMLISIEGELMDGQHRLTALHRLFNNGVTLDAWQVIRFGVQPSRMVDIDNGVTRTYKDALLLAGTIKDIKIASALRTYAGFISETHRTKFTASELEEILPDFSKVFEIGNFMSIPGCGTLTSHSYRPPAWVVVAFRLAQEKYGTEAMKKVYDEFYNCRDLSFPMANFRNLLLTSYKKIYVRVPLEQQSRTILGIFFNAVEKSLNGEKAAQSLRPKKVGIYFGSYEF